jgi:hypothetical protein
LAGSSPEMPNTAALVAVRADHESRIEHISLVQPGVAAAG